MSIEAASAPRSARRAVYEDFEVGDVYRGRIGRTVTEADNVWFTCLTMNTNQTHSNAVFAERTRFRRLLVKSTLTLALVSGMSVPDTSENAVANLGWDDVKLPHPVFVGDTLWVESEVLRARESRSRPTVGLIEVGCRGINQRREVVTEFRRTFMVAKRGSSEASDTFPGTDTEWTV